MQTLAASAAGFVVVAGLGVGTYFALSAARPAIADCPGAATAGAAIGGPFEMVDHRGATVTDAEVIDGLTLMYFGYTYCPDVCPLDTVRNAEAVAQLDEQGISVKPVFVTIDPQRDTPEVLGDFVYNIHDGMVGLTGSQEQIDKIVSTYRVYANKAGDDPEDYLMDHSTYSYLMAPEMGLVTYYNRTATPEEIAESAACYAKALG